MIFHFRNLIVALHSGHNTKRKCLRSDDVTSVWDPWIEFQRNHQWLSYCHGNTHLFLTWWIRIQAVVFRGICGLGWAPCKMRYERRLSVWIWFMKADVCSSPLSHIYYIIAWRTFSLIRYFSAFKANKGQPADRTSFTPELNEFQHRVTWLLTLWFRLEDCLACAGANREEYAVTW